jgi:Tol biopolymer transport system component
LRSRPWILIVALSLAATGCAPSPLRPLGAIDQQLERAGINREPSLSGNWLALINGRHGREQVLLVDLVANRPVPVPGLNRPDAQPVSVSVDGGGERLALVRQLEGRTELVLYRRSLQALQPLRLDPPGVARQVALSADGRHLAVQVSRGGVWQLDLFELP